MAEMTLAEFRRYLVINQDNISESLAEQPDLYYRVSEHCAYLAAERDSAKLESDELYAELDKQFRSDAATKEEKITEAALQHKIRLAPKMQALQRELGELRARADAWAAMKEAYQQRSFMMRELVALQIARLRDLNIESSASAGVRDMAAASYEVGQSRGAPPPLRRRRPAVES